MSLSCDESMMHNVFPRFRRFEHLQSRRTIFCCRLIVFLFSLVSFIKSFTINIRNRPCEAWLARNGWRGEARGGEAWMARRGEARREWRGVTTTLIQQSFSRISREETILKFYCHSITARITKYFVMKLRLGSFEVTMDEFLGECFQYMLQLQPMLLQKC